MSQVAAITDAQWGALGIVLVGLFAAVASVVSALIGLAAKRSAEDRIGTPNGHGDDIMSMLGKMLDGQAGQDTRLAVIERRQIQQAERLSSVERTQQTFCAAVHGLTEVQVDPPD